MDQKIYKDMLGNELKAEFGVGGFNNDITYVKLYRRINLPILSWFKKGIWKEVYSTVTCDSLEVVANWTDKEYTQLIIKAISEYNKKTVSREAVKLRIKTLNSY